MLFIDRIIIPFLFRTCSDEQDNVNQTGCCRFELHFEIEQVKKGGGGLNSFENHLSNVYEQIAEKISIVPVTIFYIIIIKQFNILLV